MQATCLGAERDIEHVLGRASVEGGVRSSENGTGLSKLVSIVASVSPPVNARRNDPSVSKRQVRKAETVCHWQ